MAGYSKLYVVGGLGGFMGADGVNPIDFLVLVGDADRQWFEPHYFDRSLSNSLMDAIINYEGCLCFAGTRTNKRRT